MSRRRNSAVHGGVRVICHVITLLSLCNGIGCMCDTIDIYTVDTVPPVHIVSNHEATAKSTTQDGGMAETSVNAFVYRSVDVST